MGTGELIRLKVQICISQESLAVISPKIGIKRRLSRSGSFSSISDEYRGTFIYKQYIVLMSPLEHICNVKIIATSMYHKLYPDEMMVAIKTLRDSHGYDLCDDMIVGDLLDDSDIIVAICEFASESCPSADNVVRHPLPCRHLPLKISRLATPESLVGDQVDSLKEPDIDQVDKKQREHDAASSSSSSKSSPESQHVASVEEAVSAEPCTTMEPVSLVHQNQKNDLERPECSTLTDLEATDNADSTSEGTETSDSESGTESDGSSGTSSSVSSEDHIVVPIEASSEPPPKKLDNDIVESASSSEVSSEVTDSDEQSGSEYSSDDDADDAAEYVAEPIQETNRSNQGIAPDSAPLPGKKYGSHLFSGQQLVGKLN